MILIWSLFSNLVVVERQIPGNMSDCETWDCGERQGERKRGANEGNGRGRVASYPLPR